MTPYLSLSLSCSFSFSFSLFSILTILLLVVDARKWSPEDYRINGFDHKISDDEMYSGYLPILMENNDEGSFFFWLSMQRNPKPKAGKERLIVWLNGGPGCSSMLGNLAENGPLNLKDATNHSFTLEKNQFSWTEAAHVVFVEQPIRVGFSQAEESSNPIRTEHQIARDFRGFLSSFFEVFPHLDGIPVYITGESYAGFYIPWIADYILKKQVSDDYSDGVYRHINLQGVAIGNGALDYMIMIPSYAEYMYTHGFIPLSARQYFDKLWTQCLEKVLYSGHVVTVGAMQKCGLLERVLEASGTPNMYNTKTYLPYDSKISTLSLFLNNPQVQEILHVRGQNIPGINFQPEDRNSNFAELDIELKNSKKSTNTYFQPKFWQVCNGDITAAMQADHPVSTVPALAYISKRIKVLLYNGALDLSCNHLGIVHALEANLWSGRPWSHAVRSLTKFKDDVVGQHYQLGNLSFYILRDAGHLAPMDLPGPSLDMIKRFINDESFIDVELPPDAFYPSLLVDEVDDSIGVDDTVERVDDDLNFPPQNPVIQAPIVSQLIDQTNSPTLSLDTSSKTGDSPETSNTSLVGGVIFAALVGIIFFVVKGSLNGIDRQSYTPLPNTEDGQRQELEIRI